VRPAMMNRPWSEIRQSYERYSNAPMARDMLHLIKAIEASQYACGLFAWKSMHTLCITQTPEVEYPYFGPVLRVSADSPGELTFRYFDGSKREEQWHRTVPADDAFAHLETFIAERRWFMPNSR
jgi:hypothetical protein